jgi:glycosyltransferase involved in cell wall biosynthesis
VIPHLAHERWQTTNPNKIIDYMASGVAVLASDARPTRRVIEETGCGLWYRSGDAGHMAGQIEAMWRDSGRARFGEAGRKAIRTRYNWERDGAALLEALERLVPGSAGVSAG